MLYGLQGLPGLDPRKDRGAGRRTNQLGFRIRNLTGGPGPDWWRVTEMEAYSEPEYSGFKLSRLSNSIISTTSAGGEPAANAFDENVGTYWGGQAHSTLDQYLGATFAKELPTPIRSVRFHTYLSGNHNVYGVALDLLIGSDWQQVATIADASAASTWFGWASL